MPRECWLSYNGIMSIKVDRHRVQRACRYFELLLNSTFKEGKQSIINMYFDESFSYEAFSMIVKYADSNTFIADPDKLEQYFEAIQLCMLWGYDDFMDVLEAHLIAQLSHETIIEIQGLANRHREHLSELDRHCREFDETKRIDLNYPTWWPTCSIEDHPRHYAGYCFASNKKPAQELEDQKDELSNYITRYSAPMTEDDRHELAEFRFKRASECRGTTRRWFMYKNMTHHSDVSVEEYKNHLCLL